MTEAPVAARASTTAASNDHLNRLVDRIAAGDRTAFRCLYAFLAMGVWRDATRALAHPVDARAATRSTFVEVWHLARHHVDHRRVGTRAWIAAITARQIDQRLRAPTTPSPFRSDYDGHVHRELATLLGAGRATIRIGPATFTRVNDLDLTSWPEPSRDDRPAGSTAPAASLRDQAALPVPR
jgi:hypothetical protein